MNTDFRELILKHKGKRICVMGGSPQLAEHLAQVEADVYISTNAHGVDIRAPNYLLAMDSVNSRNGRPMGDYLRSQCAAPIISRHAYADHQFVTWPQAPRDVLSGMVATWAAFCMGAKVVILAGFDGYAKDRPSRLSGYTFEAIKMARDVKCPVRVVGGGLAGAWPAYDPAEKFGKYTPHSSIGYWKGSDDLVRIRVRKPTQIRGSYRSKGEELNVMRHEVVRHLKHRMAEEI